MIKSNEADTGGLSGMPDVPNILVSRWDIYTLLQAAEFGFSDEDLSGKYRRLGAIRRAKEAAKKFDEVDE